MPEELKKYVAESRAKGFSNEQIKQNLLSTGWPEAEVNQALGLGSQAPTPVPAPPLNVQAIKISNTNVMAALSYLGILIIVPILTAKDDPFVKFHIKQGIALIILWAVIWILSFGWGMLMVIIKFPLFGLISILFPFLWLLSVGLMIMGIVNAATGKQKELPVVGSWGNRFNF